MLLIFPCIRLRAILTMWPSLSSFGIFMHAAHPIKPFSLICLSIHFTFDNRKSSSANCERKAWVY